MADWDERDHPRWPDGAPKGKGGEFRPKGVKAVRDLATLSRSTLLKYARERGLVLPRGVDDEMVRKAIRSHDSGGGEGWASRAVGQLVGSRG